MSSPDASSVVNEAARLVTVASTLLVGADRVFVEVRGPERPASAGVSLLSESGWRGASIVETGSDGLLNSLEDAQISGAQLLIVDEVGRAQGVLAQLAERSVWPLILVTTSGPGEQPPSFDTYRPAYFDGVHDYYVANDRAAVTKRLVIAILDAQADVRRWRTSALHGWNARSSLSHGISANQELLAMKQTVSWRITPAASRSAASGTNRNEMMPSILEPSIDSALAQRITAVAEVLLAADDPTPFTLGSSWPDVGDLLRLLVAAVHGRPTPARMWLLCTAISTVMPDPEDLREALRTFELSTVDESVHWLMEACLGAALDFGNPALELQIIQNAVVVEVDFSARFNLHTGIQRVARALLPRWDRDHDIIPIAWAPGYGLTRTLAADEADRVLRWHGGKGDEINTSTTALDPNAWSLLVPWNCVVVLAEVPSRAVCERLAGLAEHSSNRLVGIGYDCIPVVSADLVPPAEPNRFVRYLSIVKYMDRIAGISVSATAEFRGFAHALRPQGLAGPDVVECRLPTEVIGPIADPAPTPGTTDSIEAAEPTILCVGSFEPRKNQVALLYAAEALWREGHRFRLQLIGGGGWGTNMNKLVKRLVRRGRAITVSRAISDVDLEHAFHSAYFSVFPSLHEGYGLPVAESLAYNLPVITTVYGSTAEIAASGGALLIDPRSDEDLTNAMRTLLTDRDLVSRLRAETQDLPARSWDEYATELWTSLIEAEHETFVS